MSGLAAYAVFSEAAHNSALDDRVRTLTSQNAVLQQQISDRQQQIGEASNASWLEEQARRLGLVFPGETVYIITAPGAALPPVGGVNAPLPTFSPSPSPSSAASSPSPSASSTPRPSPTPVTFVLPSPTPR